MSISDRNTTFSDGQHIVRATPVTYAPIKHKDYFVSSNVIDLGVKGNDIWGSGQDNTPGWWAANRLHLIVYNHSTSYGSPTSGDFGISLRGVTYVTHATPNTLHGYTYVSSGTIVHQILSMYMDVIWDVSVPRVDHRFLYLRYSFTDWNRFYLNAWLEIGDGQQWRRRLVAYP